MKQHSIARKIFVFPLAIALLLMTAIATPVFADDPVPPPTPPPDATPPPDFTPPPDYVPPGDDWVPPEDWVPPPDDWVPPDGALPPDPGWMPGEDGSWLPPDNFTPPEWWTPPDGWQPGEPLPPGTAPWEQLPGAGTPDFTPDMPGGVPPGGIAPDIPSGWTLGENTTWLPPDNFTPPEWWTPPDGWQPGEPLPPGTAPWEQWNQGIEGFPPPAVPLPPGDHAPVVGWIPGDDGSWMPPPEFDPPAWWIPPEGWEFGDPLPAGTSPWEQLGLVPPVPGGFPEVDLPGGIDGFFGPGGPSIGDLAGISLPEVDVPGMGGMPPVFNPFAAGGIPTLGEPEPMYDINGDPVIGVDGEQVMGRYVYDSNGEIITGPDGYPIWVSDPQGPFPPAVPLPPGDHAPVVGWIPGDDGSWMPPPEFDPPAWWIPPDGWEFGEPLPAGTTPWEQIGFNGPDGFEGIPPFVPPPGMGAVIPDIEALTIPLPEVPVPPAPDPVPAGTVVPGTFGNFTYSPVIQMTGPDGAPVYDENGNPLYVQMVLDADGNPVTGPFGYPVVTVVNN